MTNPNKLKTHHLVQAPVLPLDEDGVVVGVIGTVLFAVATVVLWLNQPALEAHQDGWWLWTGVTGTVLGALGTAYCVYRKKHRDR